MPISFENIKCLVSYPTSKELIKKRRLILSKAKNKPPSVSALGDVTRVLVTFMWTHVRFRAAWGGKWVNLTLFLLKASVFLILYLIPYSLSITLKMAYSKNNKMAAPWSGTFCSGCTVKDWNLYFSIFLFFAITRVTYERKKHLMFFS